MKMDPIIIDDDDDDVQVVCEMGQQPSRTKNLDQQIELLLAMYDSKEPTPAQYRKFCARGKLLKPHFSDKVISDTWVTAYKTYLRRTSANVGELTQRSKSPPIVDLTNNLEENFVPSTSRGNVDPSTPSTSRGNLEHQSTSTTSIDFSITSIDLSSDESNDGEDRYPVIYVADPSNKHNIEPVAIFKNPLFHADKQIDEASWAMDNLPGSVAPIGLTLPRRATSVNNGVQETSERKLVTNKRKRSECKEVTKNCKMLSKSELKKFKKEQSKKRHQEAKDLLEKEMELMHNRWVDIIIPKYFNKELLSKCATNNNDDV